MLHSPEGGPKTPEKAQPKEWREIPRAHDVIAIGDLHGRREALFENGKFAHILREEAGEVFWSGGNAHVVFLGDILADRFLDGPHILRDIHKLGKEAQAAGGSVTLLAGNHDLWGLSYLLNEGFGKESAEDLPYHGTREYNQGNGFFSFLSLAGIPLPQNFSLLARDEKYFLIQDTLAKNEVRQAIRHTIAQSPELQEHYAQYRILHRIDDTLFTHCEPTQNMMDDLVKRAREANSLDTAIADVNMLFQENIRRCLAHPGAKPDEAYGIVSALYTATENREALSSRNTVQDLRSFGINAIVHGHTPPANTLHGDLEAHEFPHEFLVLSADRSALKNSNTLHRRSVATIQKNGEIFCGEQHKAYRSR